MKTLVDWFDNRTGIRAIVHSALYENIPGGARWRYVWGSTLVFAFATQMVTGLLLWMAYSPSSQSAWESVYYIQHEMTLGWLLRGVHHFTAQAMIVLLALHLMQVVVDGAYRAPREVNFWLGLILMQIVLGLSLTGYLLPWDQKGYWATRVATNIAGVIPVFGSMIQRVVVGGPEYGHHTLTRFFALHAGVLPATLVGFLALHLAIFRRHGVHARDPKRRPDAPFWPDQVLRDAVACLAVLAVVLFLICKPYLFGEVGAGEVTKLGAELGPPADGSQNYDARPEWYFLFLFQFLKYFQGHTGELIGAVVLPGLAMGVLFAMPIIGRWKLGHRFNIGFLLVMLLGAGLLTAQAVYEDRHSAWIKEPAAANAKALERFKRSREFLKAVQKAEVDGHRAVVLARQGIDARGMVFMMRQDPKSQGPMLFTQHCKGCHSHSVDGEGLIAEQPTAPNLGGFASRKWIAGLLNKEKIATPEYFGLSPHKEGDMVNYVKDLELDAGQVESVVVALSAQAGLKDQKNEDIADAKKIAAGTELIKSDEHCGMCHKFGEAGPGLGTAPDLTGYGSREWLIGMISNPNHERFYAHAKTEVPKTNKQPMPAFASGADPKNNLLSPHDLDLLVDWLRGEWFEGAEEK